MTTETYSATDISAAIINGDLEVQVARNELNSIRATLQAMGYGFTEDVFTEALALAQENPYMQRMVENLRNKDEA